MTLSEFSQLPKTELHLHLDCSLSYDVVKKIDKTISYTDYRESIIAPAKCLDLADYIKRAAKAIDLMQSAEQLQLVTSDLMDQLKRDNVIYAELRFAPLLHNRQGLSPSKVVEVVNDAVSESMKRTGIEARIILCTLRHYSEEQSMQTAQLVNEFAGTNVVALDIAGDEAGYNLANHVKAFKFAHEAGIHTTAHAGEAKGPESVWETIRELNPKRIGHGVRSAEDPELIDFIKARNLHLEVCPTSNVQTNVYDKIEDHAADKLYKAGVSMSINTDARAISNVTLGDEYRTLQRLFHWGLDQLLACNSQAIDHCFADSSTKSDITRRLRESYSQLGSS
jgi:adenosine deaminase